MLRCTELGGTPHSHGPYANQLDTSADSVQASEMPQHWGRKATTVYKPLPALTTDPDSMPALARNGSFYGPLDLFYNGRGISLLNLIEQKNSCWYWSNPVDNNDQLEVGQKWNLLCLALITIFSSVYKWQYMDAFCSFGIIHFAKVMRVQTSIRVSICEVPNLHHQKNCLRLALCPRLLVMSVELLKGSVRPSPIRIPINSRGDN